MSFERNAEGDRRDSFSKIRGLQIDNAEDLNVEIRDFNILIDGKSFFELTAKSKEEVYEKINEMKRNNDYTTGKLLDFAYFKENYILIAIHLSKQTKSKDLQQINFIDKLEDQNIGAIMFFTIEKLEETTFEFSQNSVNIL